MPVAFAWPTKQAGLYSVRIHIGGDLGATVEISQCDPISPDMLTEAMKLVALALGASVPKPTATTATLPLPPINGTRTNFVVSNPELDQVMKARNATMGIVPEPTPPPAEAEKEA